MIHDIDDSHTRLSFFVKPLKEITLNAMIEWCIICDKETPFIKEGFCYCCGAHSAHGDYYDQDLSEKEFKELQEAMIQDTVKVRIHRKGFTVIGKPTY